MKKYIYIIILIIPFLGLSQNKNYFGLQIYPLVTSETIYATGVYFDYNRILKNNYFIKFGYGIFYDNYWQPQYFYETNAYNKWSNETFANNIKYPGAFNIPDKDLIDKLNNSGFANFNIEGSHRIDHFINFNFGYNLKFGKNKKWSFSPSAGIILGLADRSYSCGAGNYVLLKKLGEPHPLYPQDNTYFYIVFQIRSRALYTGYNLKFDLDRKLSSRFSLGFSTGCNFSVGKDFGGEQQFIFTGLNAKAYF